MFFSPAGLPPRRRPCPELSQGWADSALAVVSAYAALPPEIRRDMPRFIWRLLKNLSWGILGGASGGLSFVREGSVRGVGYSAWCEAPPKIGGCIAARPAGTLAAEKYVLGRRSRSKHDCILFRRPRPAELCEACPTGRVRWAERLVGPFEAAARTWEPCRASPLGGKVRGPFEGSPPGPARCALPGESVGRQVSGYPKGGFPYPKAFPSGEGAPVRTLGRMRGDPVPNLSL